MGAGGGGVGGAASVGRVVGQLVGCGCGCGCAEPAQALHTILLLLTPALLAPDSLLQDLSNKLWASSDAGAWATMLPWVVQHLRFPARRQRFLRTLLWGMMERSQQVRAWAGGSWALNAGRGVGG